MMRKFLILIGFMLVSLNTQAVLLTDLLNGQSIIAGDKLFDQWAVLFEDASEVGRVVDTDNIDVSALNDGGLDPGPGLHFEILNDEFLVDGDDIYAYLDFMFGFRATVLDPALWIKDNSLSLIGATLINSSSLTSVFIEETIYADASMNDFLGVKDVEFSTLVDANGVSNQTIKTFDAANFNPTKSIYVTKNILIEADFLGEAARLESFEQRFSQIRIPEPGSLMLLGMGLFALRFGRKSK